MVSTAKRRYDVEALRREHPIADVIAGSGVELLPRGRALVGRCPFHVDGGRPNLYVYPDTQSWHCYRCAVGGDVIDFLRRRDNLGFLEACQQLAGLPSQPRQAHQPRRNTRERRWDHLTLEEQVVMNTVCSLYQQSLRREPRALSYLRERAIPDWVMRRCALGYADGHSLEAYLRRHWGLSVAQDLGLLYRGGRHDDGPGLGEFFAGRIVIPELRGGQCIWLIGRDIQQDPQRPRYLALGGERPVLGLERAIGRHEVFLVEGVVDWLTAVCWKLPTFSPCGTNLPPERLGFLARARVVYGVLDGDDAGRAAAERFAQYLGRRFVPVQLPDGCDLNDLARQPGGRDAFFRLVTAARRMQHMEDGHER